MILTVHDELLFEALRETAEESRCRRPRTDGTRRAPARATDRRCGYRGELERGEELAQPFGHDLASRFQLGPDLTPDTRRQTFIFITDESRDTLRFPL